MKNLVSGGTCIAAARCKAGAAITTLFNMTFTVGPSVPPGPLPVNIIQTVLTNANAGYASPEAIPILIGALTNQPNLALAYPALPSTIVPGTITVFSGIVDTDGDGIDDAWEITHFGNLTTVNATSDFDKDGYSDKQEYLNSKNGEMDSKGNPFDPKIMNAPGATGYKSSRCDFNGDGKPDILWRNNSLSGENVVWYMNGTAFTGWDYLPAVAGSSWTIAGVSDFNADGNPDILWRNVASGENVVWYMNGVAFTGWDSLPSVADSNWSIENH